MKNVFKRAVSTSLMLMGLGLAGMASAQGTWDLSTATCDPYGSAPGAAGCTVGAVNAEVTAWGNTGSGGKYLRANITDQSTSGVGASSVLGQTTGSIAAGTVETTNSGHHAFDNVGETDWLSPYLGGSNEMALLKFNSSVNLSGIAIGWYQTDADISILRWTGATGPDLTTMTTTGATDGLIAKGWSLVNSDDVDPNYTMNSGTSLYSSWWLVSTYFGANATDSTGSLDKGNDYFKLLSFTANVCTGTVGSNGVCTPGGGGSVPEPGSLALAGLALFGVVASRRKVKAMI